MNKKLAKRLKNFDSSKIRLAFESADEIPNSIDLSIGFPEDDTPSHIKEAGIAAIRNNQTRYTASNGILELRQVISEKLERENSITTQASNVTITPGITTGILLAYLALLDPGDEVLLPDPFFPPYKDLALMLGAKPVLIDTAPSFQLTAADIEPLINNKTKLLIINSPNNPSGAVYPKDELVKIATLAKKHDIIVVSDEVYEYFSYDKPHFSIGSVYQNTLTLNGFSKSHAMTGWRVGYINGPIEIIEAINELQQYIVFSSSSIGQFAALEAYRQRSNTLAEKYKSKRDVAIKLTGDTFGSVKGAEGAFYLFLKLPGNISDVKLVNHLAHRGVIILPGSAFSGHNDYIRISYAAEKTNLEHGLELLKESVRQMLGANN